MRHHKIRLQCPVPDRQLLCGLGQTAYRAGALVLVGIAVGHDVAARACVAILDNQDVITSAQMELVNSGEYILLAAGEERQTQQKQHQNQQIFHARFVSRIQLPHPARTGKTTTGYCSGADPHASDLESVGRESMLRPE